MKRKKKQNQSKMKKKTTLLTIFAVIIFLGSLSGTLYIKKIYDNHKKFLASVLHTGTTVLGTSTERIEINVDFNDQIAEGSQYVFGGANAPVISHPQAWDLIASSGVTSIRRDFWMETELPTKISLQDYKNNKNNVQDPKTWNWDKGWNNIDIVNQSYKFAKDRGMKTIAILTYTPAWLTYSGTEHGVPKDWDVYRDLVKKLYKIHRPYIDMMEIWNEPTYRNFLVLKNSPYKTMPDAYKDIYVNAIRAIKEVDDELNDGKRMPIIAVVGHTPMDTSVLEKILSSPDTKNDISAISYHNYHIEEPSNTFYKDITRKYGKENLPLYLTEWNYTPDEDKSDPHKTGDPAISFTGKKLIGFLNEGLAGANYFSVSFNDTSRPNSIQSTFGFYRLDKNKKPYLLPQGKTWQLLSKSLKLGQGMSKIYKAYPPSEIVMTAFINSSNEKGLAFANDKNSDGYISLPLHMLNALDGDTVNVYVASSLSDGKTPCEINLPSNSSDKSLWLMLPKQSVVGIAVIKTPLTAATAIKKTLGTTPSSTCSILK